MTFQSFGDLKSPHLQERTWRSDRQDEDHRNVVGIQQRGRGRQRGELQVVKRWFLKHRSVAEKKGSSNGLGFTTLS